MTENPSTIEEALSGKNLIELKKAMQEEFDALVKNKTWMLVKKTVGRKIIKCRWVLKTKYKSNGTIERRKARLVAKGCSQQLGFDYQETYAPVARISSIRVLVALVVENSLKIYQMDVTMAYINGDLEEEIFMEQAEGFIKPEEEHLVCCLKKSLYDLKQSRRQWHKKIDNTLQKYDMIHLNSDRCVYQKTDENDFMILVIYVDDIIVAVKDIALFKSLGIKYLLMART